MYVATIRPYSSVVPTMCVICIYSLLAISYNEVTINLIFNLTKLQK